MQKYYKMSKTLKDYLKFLFPTSLPGQINDSKSYRDLILQLELNLIRTNTTYNAQSGVIFKDIRDDVSIEDLLEIIKNTCDKECKGFCIHETHFYLDILGKLSCDCEQIILDKEICSINIYPQPYSITKCTEKTFLLGLNKEISQGNSESEICTQCSQTGKISYFLFNSPKSIIFKCIFNNTDYKEILSLLRSLNSSISKSFINTDEKYSISSFLFTNSQQNVVLFLDKTWMLYKNEISFEVSLYEALLFLTYKGFTISYILYSKQKTKFLLKEHEWSRLNYELFQIFSKRNLKFIPNLRSAQLSELII